MPWSTPGFYGLWLMLFIHCFILTARSLAGIVGPLLNTSVYEQTNSYQQSLYVFGGAACLFFAGGVHAYEVGSVKNPSPK